MKVFLSHSSADKDLARRLAHDLESAHIDVWLDQWEIRIGDEFVQKIEQGLDEVEFVIVLLTPASVASEWVDREWRHKVQHEAQHKRIAIVPVRGEPCEIPDFLAQRSHADISGGSYPMGLAHLLAILRFYADEADLPASPIETKPPAQTMLPIVTPIALEVGRELISLFEPDGAGANRALDELAPRVRDALQAEFGFVFPGISVRGNDIDMPPRGALIMVDEVPELVLDVGRDGDAAEHLFGELQAVLRRMASSFIDIDVARRLVDAVGPATETVPKRVSWFELTDVLRRLVDEDIAIHDIGRVLEAFSTCKHGPHDTAALAEQARHALCGQISAKFLRGRDTLPVLLLDRQTEAAVGSAIQHTPVGAYLALDPALADKLLASVRVEMTSLGPGADGAPILVTSPELRPFIRRLVGLEFPTLHVLSRQDIVPGTQIDIVGTLGLGAASP